MLGDLFLGIGIGAVATGSAFAIWLYFKNLENYIEDLNRRMDDVDNFIRNFPSPEEMAQRILRTKIPITDVPPDFKDKMMKAFDKVKTDSDQEKSAENITNPSMDSGGMSYVG